MLKEMDCRKEIRPSLAYRCESCHICGIVFYDLGRSIKEIVAAIQFDHEERNPNCEAGDEMVRVLPEARIEP